MRNNGHDRQSGTADVVIVGGGVIGLSIARSLARRDIQRVVLVERARLGAEASSAAAGMLAPQAEADCADEFFKLACASRDMYPRFAQTLLEESGIDIELERTGTLYVAFSHRDREEIVHRFHWQRDAGLSVEMLTGDEARLLEPRISDAVCGALRFPLDTQVENRKLVAALGNAVESYGVSLLTGINVETLLFDKERIDGVQTSAGAISAPIVVLANGAWVSSVSAANKRLPGFRIEPVRGQMLCFESNPRISRHVIYSSRGYIVPRLDGRLLAGSTTERAGFDKRVTAEGIQAITANAIEIAPSIGRLPVLDSWSGLRPRAQDDLPVIGGCRDVEGLFFALGHYRNGILLTPITGELLAEEITTGYSSPMLSAFRPDRFEVARAV